MPDHAQDDDTQLSAAQLALLGGFEGEAAEVFSELETAAPGDAALVERLADAAITAGPVGPAASGVGHGAGGATVGVKVAAGVGLAAIAGIVVAALWSGGPSQPAGTPAPVPVKAIVAAEPEPPGAPQEPPVALPSPDEVSPTADEDPAPPVPEERSRSSAPPSAERRKPEPETEPEPALSARDLLKAANAARRTGDYAKAEAGYERLAREFSGSREAMIGRVSLGKLQLERLGKPAEALRNFDAYLAASGRGNLAEEALYGRARALRRLGEHAEERAAWSKLLERFPNTVHADEARRNLGSGG